MSASRSFRSRLVAGSVLWTLGVMLVISVVLVVFLATHPRPHAALFDWFIALPLLVSVIVGLVCMAAGALLIGRAVQAMHLLRARLADVHGGTATRLSGDYPTEIQPLVDDLNTLLAARDERATRAAARAADLAHGLKTPLAVLAHDADRVATHDAALGASLAAQVSRMARQIDYHLSQARVVAAGTVAGLRAPVAPAVDGLFRALGRLHADRELTLVPDIATDHAVRCAPEDLDEMLGNVLDNACTWGRRRVHVTSSRRGDAITITVDDDGDGLDPALMPRVLQRGVRADERVPGLRARLGHRQRSGGVVRRLAHAGALAPWRAARTPDTAGRLGMNSPSVGPTRRASTARPWYTLAVLTLANVSGLLDRQVVALLVEPLKRDLLLSDTQVSLLMGLSFALFYSVLGLPVGVLVDRYSRRRIVAIGAVLWSGMTVLCGFAQSFGQLLVLRMGVGVGEATLVPSAVSLISDVFPQEHRARAMSVFALGTFLGSGIAYAIGAYVAGFSAAGATIALPLVGAIRSWQVVFLVVGLPGLVIGALALTIDEPRTVPAAPHPLRDVLDYGVRHRRTLATLSLGFACSSAVNFGIAAWLATFFVRTHGWTATEAGTLQGLLTMTFGVAGALAGGWLTDRWVARGRSDAPLLVAMIAAVGMIGSAGAYPLVASPMVAAWLLVPLNVFAAMPWGAANAAVAAAFPSRLRGQGTAMYLLVVNLFAGVVGPTSVAVVTDRFFGDAAALRYSLAICSVCGMVAVLAILGSGLGSYRRTVGAARSMRTEE